MRFSVKTKIIGLSAGLLLFAVLVTGAVAYYSIGLVINHTMLSKAQSDINLAMEVVDRTYAGSWSVQNGVLYKGTVRVNDQSDLVDRIGALTGGTVTIFLGDTRVATNVQQNGKRAIGTQAAANAVEQVLKKGLAYSGEAIVVGEPTLTNYLPIKNSNDEVVGMFYVGVSRAFVAALERQFYGLLFGGVLILLVVGTIGAWYIARRIAGPITQATHYIGLMAEGDFSITVDGKMLALHDEVGDMSRAIATMATSMRQLLRQLLQTSEQIAASSEEMTASADQSVTAAGQVAEAITEVASDAERQRAATETTTGLVANLSGELEKVTAHAEAVADLSNNAMTSVARGQQAVERAVTEMDHVGHGTSQVDAAIQELAASARRIGEIVGVITTIAGQTNLLALNAAIEAARAGEQGRGFAVVAEEVRKLAEESEKAAGEITGLVENNIVSIERAVTAMASGSEAVEQGIGVVQESGERFRELAGQVTAMAGKVEEMAVTVRTMASDSQKVLSDVRDIDEGSRKTAARAEAVSAATEEQTATMHEIASASQGLAKMAENLQVASQQFKVY